jgi:hypothetical protein
LIGALHPKGLTVKKPAVATSGITSTAKKVVVTIAVLYVQGNSGIAILTNEKISFLHN